MVLLSSLWSCFKDEEYNTEFVLRPMIQTVSGGDFVGYEDCVAYAFDADTAQWEILSWEDARSGVLTSREDPAVTKLPFAVAKSYVEDSLEDTMLSMRLDCESAMIVVAHNTTENYGYRLYDVGLNLSTTYAYARFRTWKEGEYTESYWIYYAPESTTYDDTDYDVDDDEESDVEDEVVGDADDMDDAEDPAEEDDAESDIEDEMVDDSDKTDDAEDDVESELEDEVVGDADNTDDVEDPAEEDDAESELEDEVVDDTDNTDDAEDNAEEDDAESELEDEVVDDSDNTDVTEDNTEEDEVDDNVTDDTTIITEE